MSDTQSDMPNGGENSCPHCAGELVWSKGHYHCPECGESFTRLADCPECGQPLQRLAACGAESYFCNHCNVPRSRQTLQFYFQAAE